MAGVAVAAVLGVNCGSAAHTDAASQAPPPVTVDHASTDGSIRVDHPERFELVAATRYASVSTLSVTGVVTPDVSRTIPVVSLASGRVVDLRVRLGDRVTQGQLLLRIQSPDVADAWAGLRKANADAELAHAALDRTQDLYAHKALAKRDVEAAQNASDKADVDLENARQHVRVLGADPAAAGASDVIDVFAPAAGVVIEQNVTPAAGVKTLDNSPNLLTIADLSHVWIVCDVHEADLATVHEGDAATVAVAAYPDRPLTGVVSNIGAILDPTLRTAKVRVEVANRGMLRVGLFATATFRGHQSTEMAAVPATAVLHLHDRAWVYVAGPDGAFLRREIAGGDPLPNQWIAVRTGLRPGERIVKDALVFQNTVEQ
jgi:cobalt-zinc-cadmium efflux system membrane fusion protein